MNAARGWSNLWPGWLLRGKRAETKRQEAAPAQARFRTLCISREAGAGAGQIGRLVGARLNWAVFDQELLETIATRMQLALDEVRAFDELAPSVVQDWILPLREEHYAPQEAYLDHLARLVESIGRVGDSVILGRGASFLLPRDEILSVRIVAPLRVRAVRLAERMGVSVRTARRAAIDLDRRRAHFVRTMHRFDAQDPHNYDLVLDSESLGFPVVTEILTATIEAGRAARLHAADPLAEPVDRRTAT